MSTFDARHLARAWLAVTLASSSDKARPQLHRTVSIEAFPTGVRLAATDSYVLLRAWVPALDCDDDPEPDLDEAPLRTAVVMDPHRRAKSFLTHVLKLATKAEKDEFAPTVEVFLSLHVTDADLGDPGTAAPTFEGMEARYAVLDLYDQERLKLRTYDGAYPSWRGVVDSFKPAALKDHAFGGPTRPDAVYKSRCGQPGWEGERPHMMDHVG